MEESGNYLIAFLDLLSTSKRIENEDTRQRIIDLAYEFAVSVKQNNRHGIKAFTFSDNIAICMRVEDEKMLGESLKNLCSYVCHNLLFYLGVPSDEINTTTGFMTPIRGSITYGSLTIDEDINFICGSGLVRAYLLESKIAFYPRVIVDHRLDKYIQHREEIQTWFFKDADGFYYVDFLEYCFLYEETMRLFILKQIKELVEIECQNARKKDNYSVQQKYEWLKNYVDRFCNKHQLLR